MTTEERTHWRASTGKAIYQEKIAPQLEPEHKGEIIATDVETGEWAIGPHSMEQAEANLGSRPGRQTYFHRVGHRTLVRMGWARR